MTFVVARDGRPFELRESSNGPKGPRAQTLATFHVLDDRVFDRAEARAGRPLDRNEVRRAARRAGAEVAPPAADAAAGTLLAQLARRQEPTPVRRRLLARSLASRRVPQMPEHLVAAAEWAGSTAAERGAALNDLLALVDALPVKRGARRSRFPRLRSPA